MGERGCLVNALGRESLNSLRWLSSLRRTMRAQGNTEGQEGHPCDLQECTGCLRQPFVVELCKSQRLVVGGKFAKTPDFQSLASLLERCFC